MLPGSARLWPVVCVSNNVTWSGDYRGDMTIWLQHQYSLQPRVLVTVSPGWKVEISRQGDSAVSVYNVVCCHLVDIICCHPSPCLVYCSADSKDTDEHNNWLVVYSTVSIDDSSYRKKTVSMCYMANIHYILTIVTCHELSAVSSKLPC